MIILLGEGQHSALKKKAALAELTLSNYVRKCLGLPLEHQGKRHEGIPASIPVVDHQP
jgi:hypothetical protein